MDKARKPDRARPKKGAGPSTSNPPRREVRVNRRALVLVVLAGVLAVPALLGLKALQDRLGRSALLLEAKKQRDEAKRPDLALGYFNRYLELAPDDLDALDQRAELLAEAAHERLAIDSAIKAHVLLLGKGGDGRARGATRKRLAGLYLRLDQFRAAEQTIRDHLRLEPGDVEGRRVLARALEGAGRLGDAQALEAAVAEYEAAEALQPGDVASGERLASLYLDKFGDRPRAIRIMDALLEHNPRSVAARLARSRFFASLGDARAASDEVDEALRIDPSDVDARLAAAEAAVKRNNPVVARRHLDAIQPPRPDDLRVKILRGQIELAERKADLAIRDWQDGLALANGGDAELTWRLAHVLIQLGRPRQAAPLIAQYRRLSGSDEPSPAGRYLVGLAMLKSGRTAEAIAELEAIRYKLDKGLEGLLYLGLGQAYEASPEPAKAADAYQRATASPVAGAAPWLALARLQAVDRPGDQVATLERGIAAVGPDERLLAGLARGLWRKQAARPSDKRDWSELERVLKSAPDSAELVLIRAELAASVGRPEDGLAVLEAATRRNPTSAPIWLALAEALARLGRGVEAVARLDEAVASGGDQAGFRIARARYALGKGNVKAARIALLEGLERVPSEQRPMLAKAQGEFHLGQGDRVAARQAFLEWASLQPESIDPHLTLLNLAIEAVDDRSVDLEVEALKAIGGPSSLYWKVARAESLLRDRPGLPPSPAMLDEAARLVAEIKTSTPRQPSGVLLEARLMEHRGRLDDAIQAYEKAIELKGGPMAVKPLAGLLTRLGRLDDLAALRAKVGGFLVDVDRTLAASTSTPRRKTDDPRAREALARAFLDPVERSKAREQATKAAGAVDAPLDAIRLAAALDLADGDLDAASRQVARLEALGLDDPATLELKARLLKARGKPGEAVASLEKAFDDAGSSPGSLDFGRGVVRLLTALDEPEAAGRLARKVARLGPLGQVVLAEWLGSRGRFDEASAAYDAATHDRQGAREAARSALAMASTTREPRWSDLADRLLDRAIGTGPVDDELAYARASLRHLQGRLEEAVKAYDELAARSPANLLFLNNGAWILSEDLNRPREALERIEVLKAKAGVQPHTLDTRGVILLRLGQTDRAIDDLEAAAKAVPSGPICYHLARAYLAAGRREDAARALAKASAAGLKPESLQPSERAEFARVAAAVK
jgi:cellulose synthase operon protein C